MERGHHCQLTPYESCCCHVSYMSTEKGNTFPGGEEVRENRRTEMEPTAEALKTEHCLMEKNWRV